jgi:pimeloyl-ACP methyl ester carboxylesterase
VALTLGERIDRLVAIDVLPLLPGHRWHWVPRAWRAPVLGELGMGFTGRALLRRVGGLSPAHADEVLRHFDHGTQRAILKLYRADASVTAPLDAVTAPALVVWGERDRYLDPAWAERVATALGGPAEVEIVPGAGHWPWLEAQGTVQRVADFLGIVS